MSQPTPTGTTAAASVLERILAETRAEVQRRKRELPLERLREHGAGQTAAASSAPEPPASATLGAPERSQAGTRRFRDALGGEGVGVIAEFKRRSPSAGALHEAPDLATIVHAYERGGAVAVSVLTEGPNFAGALDDLRTARGACALPLLRKDFIVDEYQLHEALHAGADAVLLIVAALTQQELASLHDAARALGLDVLVEVHDRPELRRALALGAEIIGVNNRDLRDFSVDVARTEALMDEIPAGVTVVSESGIAGAEQLRRLRARGVHAVLVGEALMRASDPAAALAQLRGF
jgi:indole-3-glycerol phosphate synthase